MTLISNYASGKWEIVQPKVFKEYYELKWAEETLGTIQLKGFFQHRAFFNSSFGNWEIYVTGFWKSVFEVKQANYELPFAKFIKDTWKSGGVIELPKGERLIIKNNIWKDSYEIQSQSGLKIVRFKKRFSLKEKTEITIDQNSEIIDRHPWVIILAWFINKVTKSHAAATG